MFGKDDNRDKSNPQSKMSQKESSNSGAEPNKRNQDKISSFEQFQERGYDSGFVYHED